MQAAVVLAMQALLAPAAQQGVLHSHQRRGQQPLWFDRLQPTTLG
jgi:hypothetical protein